MKIFFDTNVYIAEALLGTSAEAMIAATVRASWRIHCSEYVLNELERVMAERLGFSRRFAKLTRDRCRRRAIHAPEGPRESRHRVVSDPADSPILTSAIEAGADFLVTNDHHLLDLNPYHGLRIVSMSQYYERLVNEGMLSTQR